MPQDLTDDKSTLVQVMAWCHQATSHYLNQCWPRSPTPYGITRPQWVKTLGLFLYIKMPPYHWNFIMEIRSFYDHLISWGLLIDSIHLTFLSCSSKTYRQVSNIRRTLVGNKIVNHSDVVGASPVGAAPTTSSFSTYQLASLDLAKTSARRDEKHLSFGILVWLILEILR